MMRRPLVPCLILLTLLLGACGFQLRGNYTLPFESIFINLPDTGDMYASLKRAIAGGTATRVVATQSEAKVILQILNDKTDKNVLSLSATGRAREYQLVRTLKFRVVDGTGREWIKPSQLVVRRDISFNDDQILSKDSEEIMLWRDIQNDMVQQILRRLAAAKPPPAIETSSPYTPDLH